MTEISSALPFMFAFISYPHIYSKNQTGFFATKKIIPNFVVRCELCYSR